MRQVSRKARMLGLVLAAAVLLQTTVAYAAEGDLRAMSVDLGSMAAASGPALETYAGADRHDTARRIAQAECGAAGASFQGIIVVACDGGKFPDALSAAGLSGVLGYPVVAVNGSSLSVCDRAALTSLKERSASGSLDILVVGGVAAVSQPVRTALASFGTVSAPFEGSDRYETNRLVYDYGASHGGWSAERVFLASGESFPDALTIAPYLVWAKCPIMLVNPGASVLTPGQRGIVANSSSVVALGGDFAVPAQLLSDAARSSKGGAYDRLGGADRYATSAAIVKWELGQGMNLEGAGIATGEAFPDALGSSWLLGSSGSVLMLVAPNGPNAAMAVAAEGAAASGSPSLLRVFGGASAVPAAAYSRIATAVGWSAFDTVEQNQAMHSKAGYVKSASLYSQIILVEASGTSATVSLHEKDPSGMWNELMSSGGYVGRGGIGQASEDRPVTPAGLFEVPFAFGNAGNPGTAMAWHGTTWESTWVDDSDSMYYNTWQESSSYSGEHLKGIGWVYDYALVIGYNYPRYCAPRDSRTVSGAGSAFFIHCSEGKPTSGCVSVPADNMRRLVQLVKPGCRVVIGTPDTVYEC